MMQALIDTVRTLYIEESRGLRRLLEFVISGAVVITLWSLAGGLAVSTALVGGVTLALSMLYGLLLVLSAAVLARPEEDDDSEHDSVVSMSRFRREPKSEVKAVAKPLASDEVTFHRSYFLLRLQDAIRDARRHGDPMAAITLRVSARGKSPSPAVEERIAADVARLMSNQAQAVEVPSVIGPGEYALFMQETNRKTAVAFAGTLVKALGDYWCDCGVASFPEDATDASGLLAFARGQYAGEDELEPEEQPEMEAAISQAFRRSYRR
jgi:hypothetical protein